ncbi:MAG: DUF3267 domain-containing protein [Coriobacteriales bacterium]|jgi:hypothetical protein|nr:DUF3267 domain-containing protein [Coriobacteriales bacterium]
MENEEEYVEDKITINLTRANVIGVLALLFAALLFGLPYYLLWGAQTQSFDLSLRVALIAIPILLVGVIIHELIHGVTWALFAKDGFKSISFGVIWKMLTPYCHCKEPLLLRHYKIGAITPTILLGVIPAILAILMGNLPLLIFGIFFTSAGSGDLLIIYALRNEKGDTWVKDHPSEAGCYVYRPIESPKEPQHQ